MASAFLSAIKLSRIYLPFLHLPWWIMLFSKRIFMHWTAPPRVLESPFRISQSTRSRLTKQDEYMRRWYRRSRIIAGSCSAWSRFLRCSPTKMICNAFKESWSVIFNQEKPTIVAHSRCEMTHKLHDLCLLTPASAASEAGQPKWTGA